MLLHAFVPASRANGPGLRAVVYFQGCSLHCEKCWNPATHKFRGVEVPVCDLNRKMAATATLCFPAAASSASFPEGRRSNFSVRMGAASACPALGTLSIGVCTVVPCISGMCVYLSRVGETAQGCR